MVDEAFIATLRAKFPSDQLRRLSSSGALAEMIHTEWEHGIKPQFNGKSDRTWNIKVPWEAFAQDTSRREMQRSKVEITSAEVRDAFNGTAYEIHKIISSQMQAIRTKLGKGPNASCTNTNSLLGR